MGVGINSNLDARGYGRRGRPENYYSQHAKGRTAALLGSPELRCILGFVVSETHYPSFLDSTAQIINAKIIKSLLKITEGILKPDNTK